MLSMAVFSSSLMSFYYLIMCRYFLNNFETVPTAPFLLYHFRFHIPDAPHFHCKIFILKYSSCFLITYQFPEVAVSINTHVPVSSSQIMSSDLSQKLFRKLNFWFDNIVTLLLWRVFTHFGACLYQCSFLNFTHIYFRILRHSWEHTLSYRFIHCSPANIVYSDKIWPLFSSYFWQVCVCVCVAKAQIRPRRYHCWGF
jgi:hypothetical protein